MKSHFSALMSYTSYHHTLYLTCYANEVIHQLAINLSVIAVLFPQQRMDGIM